MRKLHKWAASAGIVAVGVLGLQSVAGAQTGYPGTVAQSGSNNIALSVNIGNTVSATFCSFNPGSAVTSSLGGVAQGGQAVGSAGCVTVSFAATDPHLSANGGPLVAANLGANGDVFSMVGTNTTGGTQTDTASITVLPAATAASGLAFTGADIAYMVVGGVLLIALGAFIVIFARRRTASSAS